MRYLYAAILSLTMMAAPVGNILSEDLPPMGKVDTTASAPAANPPTGVEQAQHIYTSYDKARVRAVGENKPLIVWVGAVCQKCVKSMPEYVHCTVDTFPAATPPCVVVSKPAKGELYRLADLPWLAGKDKIREALDLPIPGVTEKPDTLDELLDEAFVMRGHRLRGHVLRPARRVAVPISPGSGWTSQPARSAAPSSGSVSGSSGGFAGAASGSAGGSAAGCPSCGK